MLTAIRRASSRVSSLAVVRRPKGTRPNDGLILDHYRESPGDDGICGRAFDVPEAHLVRQVLLGHAKVRTPFLYISYPIGWRIWVQPAEGRNPVNDDRGVPEQAEEQVVVLWSRLNLGFQAAACWSWWLAQETLALPAQASRRRLQCVESDLTWIFPSLLTDSLSNASDAKPASSRNIFAVGHRRVDVLNCRRCNGFRGHVATLSRRQSGASLI
jgi:hypothetical protein